MGSVQALRHPRIAVASLGLSLVGFVALVAHESYTEKAVVPTINDRPTVGFGSTFREDGSAVQMGDTITPPKAVARSADHIAKDESALKRCVTAPVSQVEYDLLVDHAYQYGASKTCTSAVVELTNQQRYAEACGAYLHWKRSGGYDCSTLIDGRPNKRCWGVWERSMERHKKCLEAQ